MVRELPEQKGSERIRATLAQYGILPLDTGNSGSDAQTLEMKFNSRVTAVKGRVVKEIVGRGGCCDTSKVR